MKRSIVLIFSLYCFTAFSQVQEVMSSAGIQQALRKLETTGSVLYIAAHPDDENTRLISYLGGERCYRTGYLALTRGDGGQNLIGREQGDALGLIRTHELLQARNIDGGEQYFTRAIDFGYSKTPEETFHIWNKESVLADMVWVIRNFRPDVIITRFPTTGEGGHGHHTASALLAEEAFDAAGDASRFTEQLAFVQPWKTKRLFWNVFNPGAATAAASGEIRTDIGIYNPVTGKGYGELASESRSMHKSQGFGSPRTRGSQIETFRLLKGDQASDDLFEGINTTWKSLPGGDAVAKAIAAVRIKYNPASPSSIVPELDNIYNLISALPDTLQVNRWKKVKLEEIKKLIVACSGLWMEAYAENYSYCRGDTIKLSAVFLHRLKNDAEITSVIFPGGQEVKASSRFNIPDTARIQFTVHDSVPYTSPYWLNEQHSEGLYSVTNQKLIGRPVSDEPYRVRYNFTVNQRTYTVDRPVVYKYNDPVKGELYRPLEILPKVTINFPEKISVFNNAAKKTITCKVKANTSGIRGRLQLNHTDNWVIETDSLTVNLPDKNDEQTFHFTAYPLNVINKPSWLKASVTTGGKTYVSSIDRIEHEHIPPALILSDAKTKLLSLNITTVRKKIGYIEGAGDAVADCLRQMGYDVTILTDELLDTENLAKYEAIVTGVRAYNINERLQANYERLMEYIKQGGTLVVQYNTNNRIGPLIAKMGPYPFTISRDRVTDENATMSLLKRDHKILTTPNSITDDDFSGWVQERGIYFATDRDTAYTAIFETHDPESKALDGSLIVASYGQGKFIYTGLAFFRQLPAGVPGAYRLFANLIEY